MRIDSRVSPSTDRVCISIDDDLFFAFSTFFNRSEKYVVGFFRRKIYQGEIKNSNDAKLFIYSQMMKPSAFKCFAGAVPDQVDIEDV